ncbi:type II secretion system F family protein [Candidatus Dependentiae bacterium]|nr:type II secretion system F family protein [Candidatus Dependentiae bacterium]
MHQYHWRGIDSQGAFHKGRIRLESSEKLQTHLLEKEIALLSFRKKSAKRIFLQKTQTSPPDLFYHLSILLEGGIPLVQALQLTQNYTGSSRQQNEVESTIRAIERGSSFADAMASRMPFFSSLMIQIIRSGERANKLTESCKTLSIYLTRKQETIRNLKQAALLPAITLMFSIAIIISLFLFVIPQFQPMLIERSNTLPPSTRLIFSISQTLRSEQSKFIIIFGLIVILGTTRFSRNKIMFPTRLILRLPLVGRLVVLVNLTQFAQTLSLLLKSGVPLIESLHLAGDCCTNQHLRGLVKKINVHVEAGSSLHLACLSVDTHYFPASLLAAIKVGEQTGKLESMLDKGAQLLETQLQSHLQTIISMAQPILLIITGLIISFLLLSIYLPLFNFS